MWQALSVHADGDPYASTGRRLGAWLLDAALLALITTPLNPALYVDVIPSARTFLPLIVAAMVLGLVYLAAFDGGTRGATPGKRILGIRVVDAASGGPIGYRRAVVRRLGYVLGGLVLYVGWIWLIFDRRHQAWHDKMADSIVVRRASAD